MLERKGDQLPDALVDSRRREHLDDVLAHGVGQLDIFFLVQQVARDCILEWVYHLILGQDVRADLQYFRLYFIMVHHCAFGQDVDDVRLCVRVDVFNKVIY